MSFDNECMYIECLHVGTITGGGVGTTVGTPTPPRTFSTIIGIVPADTVADGLWKLDSKLALLIPAAPPNLSAITISLADTVYNAIAAISPYNLCANVENNALGTPSTAPSAEFGDADTGVLTAVVKNSAGPATTQGSITLTTGDDSGSNLTLTIISDTGYTSAPLFYNALIAKVQVGGPLTPSNVDQYSYQLMHSLSGGSNTDRKSVV